MHLWRTVYDPKVRGLHHRAARGFGHALLSPLVSRVFQILGVAAAIHEHKDNWVLLNPGPNFTGLEIEHGADKHRYAYNERQLAVARETRKLVRGEHRGYIDFFAPIVAGKTSVGTLVCGPVASADPKPKELLENWH
ncbi:MAG TPA: PocR ligand-binding domain-containing protein, partial [Polyangiaceae bacterium]|nr:PocR ligand-binding domain-containing protein [Polyangiaceae bacterium]